MKTVLILFSDVFTSGGFQAYNRHLCGALEKEFSDIRFIALSLHDEEKKQSRHWRNIEFHFCGKGRSKAMKKIKYIFKSVSTVFFEKPSFLICGHVDLSPLAAFLKRIFAIKYIVLTQGIDVWNLTRGVKYCGLKGARAILAVSKYTRNRMVENGIYEGKIKFLRHTVDISMFYRKPASHALLRKFKLENRKILLTIGRINSGESYKGHDIMLEVLRRLGGEYAWLVVGEGDDLPRIRKKTEELSLNGKVRFPGKIPNEKLVDYYNLSDIFIMPSKGEGFGIVFLEAMACGKPVIGGNKDGSAEPLMDGKLGLLVDPDNAEEIKEAIETVAYSGAEERTDPDYLRKKVEANFSIEVFNRRVKEIFSEEFN